MPVLPLFAPGTGFGSAAFITRRSIPHPAPPWPQKTGAITRLQGLG